MKSELYVKIDEVRQWIEEMKRPCGVAPDEDVVWAYIIDRWATMPTDTVEKVLCEAMKEVALEAS